MQKTRDHVSFHLFFQEQYLHSVYGKASRLSQFQISYFRCCIANITQIWPQKSDMQHRIEELCYIKFTILQILYSLFKIFLIGTSHFSFHFLVPFQFCMTSKNGLVLSSHLHDPFITLTHVHLIQNNLIQLVIISSTKLNWNSFIKMLLYPFTKEQTFMEQRPCPRNLGRLWIMTSPGPLKSCS